ncbi:MAG: radical SAM protein [Candidatus Hodarchaeota archaeon]
MIDPIKLTKTIQNEVCRNNSRKFYRFRKTQFYGGCATADCLGCNLRCVYCWAQKKIWNPEKFGEYYSPKEVSEKLTKMDLSLIRISGGEPTICKNHLFEVISLIPKNTLYILETNGILLDENYIKDLSKFKNIYVRVSLKGIDGKTFENITGAEGKFFKNQLNSLDLLKKYGIKHRAAILIDLFTDGQIQNLGIPDLEYETLIRYPFVIKHLKKKGIEIIRQH